MDGWIKVSILLIVLIIFEVRDTQGQGGCSFDIPGTPTFPSLTFTESSEVGTVLGTYGSPNVTSAIPPSDQEYITFGYVFDDATDTGLLTLVLAKSFTDKLDNGSNIIETKVRVECLDGTTPEITFSITINDVNNYAPEFDKTVYPLNLQFPWPSKVPINIELPIKVTDKDFSPENADVTFTSSNGNVTITRVPEGDGTTSPFVYNAILTLKDDQSQISENTDFQITAISGDLTQTATVQVTVEPINVYPPKFDEPLYVPTGKISWPPLQGDPIPLPPIIISDPEAFELTIGGDHSELIKVVRSGNSFTLEFDQVPDDLSAFESTNGVAVIRLLSKETASGLESTAILLLVFDTTTEGSTTTDAAGSTSDSTSPTSVTDSCDCSTSTVSSSTTEVVVTNCPDITTIADTEPPTSTEGISTSTAFSCEQCDECTPGTSSGTATTDCPTTCATEAEPVTCPTTCATEAEPVTCPTTCATEAEPVTCPTTCATEPEPVTCPTTCPEDPCTPCETTTVGTPGGDDCEESSNTGFIVGIIITSVLFVASAAAAAYLWRLLRKARVLHNLTPAETWNPPQQQARISSGSLAKPIVSPVVIDTNGDIAKRPSILKRTSFQHTNPTNLDSPTNDFGKQIESRNSLVTQAKNPLVVDNSVAAAPVPAIPQPDYRTKPDYKVKINDTVEIVPNEVTEYSDNENNPNSGANSDLEANEGEERL